MIGRFLDVCFGKLNIQRLGAQGGPAVGGVCVDSDFQWGFCSGPRRTIVCDGLAR